MQFGKCVSKFQENLPSPLRGKEMLVPVYKTISHHTPEHNLNFKFGDYLISQICWLGMLTNPFHIQAVVGLTHKDQYSDWIFRKVTVQGFTDTPGSRTVLEMLTNF